MRHAYTARHQVTETTANHDPASLRKSPRVEVQLPVTIRIKQGDSEKTFAGEVLNVSEGGAFIHGVFPVGLGQEVVVEIDLGSLTQDSQQRLAVKSAVCWVRGSSASGFGVEFRAMAKEKRHFITSLIEKAVNLSVAA